MRKHCSAAGDLMRLRIDNCHTCQAVRLRIELPLPVQWHRRPEVSSPSCIYKDYTYCYVLHRTTRLRFNYTSACPQGEPMMYVGKRTKLAVAIEKQITDPKLRLWMPHRYRVSDHRCLTDGIGDIEPKYVWCDKHDKYIYICRMRRMTERRRTQKTGKTIDRRDLYLYAALAAVVSSIFLWELVLMVAYYVLTLANCKTSNIMDHFRWFTVSTG